MKHRDRTTGNRSDQGQGRKAQGLERPGEARRSDIDRPGHEDEAIFERPIPLSENQAKVIRDKYLKDAPSPQAWLRNIARNIALADLLYDPEISREDIYSGVKHCEEKQVEEKRSEGEESHGEPHAESSASMVLLHHGITNPNDREKNFRQFLQNLTDLAERNPIAKKITSEAERKFYPLLSRFEFLPNSPTLMNAGRDLQQLSACYVLPVPDSMEGIFDAVKNQALIHKSGGGTGFSFGGLRPRDDVVKSTQGIASGPLSFMKIFDTATEQVKQGGTRRGANMAILPYWHPDILDFVRMKVNGGVLENFNISVGTDKDFFEAVRQNLEYKLTNPRTKRPVRSASASELFEHMIDAAWRCGDPGYIVLDRINESGSNTTPAVGEIEATNPCGEQPLLPNEPCNLGSINLAKFVRTDGTRPIIDYKRLRQCINTAIHFLDNVIDLNNYPIAVIERMAKSNRRIGLGVMGWAETLVLLGISYLSPEALKKAEEVMKFVNDAALEASVGLAKKRGVFLHWADSVYDSHSTHFRGEEKRPRNCARTTIAPTGTIAIAAGLQGSGIEPFFAISYVRYNAKGLDAIRQGRQPDPEDVFVEINPLFRKAAKENNYFGLKPEALWEKINRNQKSVHGIPAIPESIQHLFVTSHDVPFEQHIRMQATFQKYTDNAVSKTINCPKETTREDIARAYLMAYDLGCKGLTIYRDGSKTQQVLNLDSAEKKTTETEEDRKKARRMLRTEGSPSEYYLKQTGYGPLHVNIIFDEHGPYRIFASVPPLGTEISSLTSVIGILLSKYLEIGGDPVQILKHLNSVKGDRPHGFGTTRVDSIAHALSIVLREHLKKHGKFNGNGNGRASEGDQNQQQPPPEKERPAAEPALVEEQYTGLYCSQCYSSNVEFVSGCKQPTCFDCGYSNCS